MSSISVWHWVIVLLAYFLWIYPLWQLLKRVGHPPAIALLGVIPILGLAILWWVAFGRWPAVDTANAAPRLTT